MKSLRDIFKRLPEDGKVRHELRNFNMAPKAGGKVPSVKTLAESLGFCVERVRLPRGLAGRLVQDPFSENGYRIEVNMADNIFRQRWTVLHEMAHFFFHSDHNDPLAPAKLRDRNNPFYLADEQKEEREADEFAATLLFSDGALTAAQSLFGNDIQKLSRHFGASEAAIKIALDDGNRRL